MCCAPLPSVAAGAVSSRSISVDGSQKTQLLDGLMNCGEGRFNSRGQWNIVEADQGDVFGRP
jgi:hypothetical protein